MTSSRTRILRGGLALGAVAGAGVLALAGPASAHVVVQPSSAARGSYSTISFEVPNEQEHADTTKLQVFFPTAEPLAWVATQPVPGWKATVSTVKLAKPLTTDDGRVTRAVSSITWSGGRIAPGQFQQFPLSVGPLPDKASGLTFKALQTYGKNEVVRWIDTARPGAPEPAHPAPVLKLTAPGTASGADSGTASGTASGAAASGTAQPTPALTVISGDVRGTDTTARVLGIAGIVVGAGGVAYGVLAGRRRSRHSGGAA